MFSGIDYTDPDAVSKAAGGVAGNLNQQGGALVGAGKDALAPVFSQLMKLLSGDENSVNQAVQPRARGVVDQYDAARKAVSQFTPRGGGQANALTQSRFSEASDIAGLKSNAINSATQELGQLGTSLLNSGVQQQEASLSSLMGLISQAQQSKGSSREMWQNIGLTAGKLVASYYTGGLSQVAFSAAGV